CDTVEWLAAQPWCTGKVGTFGSSQAGFAQNFLAVTRPPHLTAQYMIDTGLSLFHEGYRIGGTTRPERFKQMDAVCRDPEDNRRRWGARAPPPTTAGPRGPARATPTRWTFHASPSAAGSTSGATARWRATSAGSPAPGRAGRVNSNPPSAPGCSAGTRTTTRS